MASNPLTAVTTAFLYFMISIDAVGVGFLKKISDANETLEDFLGQICAHGEVEAVRTDEGDETRVLPLFPEMVIPDN